MKAADARIRVTAASRTLDLWVGEDFCGFSIGKCITPPDADPVGPRGTAVPQGPTFFYPPVEPLGRCQAKALIRENLYLIPTQFGINYEIVTLARYTAVSPENRSLCKCLC